VSQAALEGGDGRDSSPAIVALRARGATPEAIDAVFAENDVPLVEGGLWTFLWRGEAHAVAVEHRVVGLTAPLPLRRIAGSDLWYTTLEMPLGARLEYRLLVRRGADVENTLDPRNPRVARGPAGEMSAVTGDGYVDPDWAQPGADVPPGKLTHVRIRSRALRRFAEITLYAPARMEQSGQYPLLIVHDGNDYLNYSAFGTVLDNLMHRRWMSDTIVAFTHPRDRMREYAASAPHTRFLNQELVPELERTLPIRGGGASRVLMGASLGAVASLCAAVRAPGMYGGLLLESGSVRTTLPAEVRTRIPALARTAPFIRSLGAVSSPVTQRIYQTYGQFEPLAQSNRSLTPTLRRLAGDVRVFEALDGHNWTNWRDRLRDALGWLLPPDAPGRTS